MRSGLPSGVAARVGSEDVSVDAVVAVAAADATTPAEARLRLIDDALFAAEAARRFAGTGVVDTARRSALARAALESVRSEAEAGGPPTANELREALDRRWVEVERPAAAKTSHAVVRFEHGQDRAAARALAQRVAVATADARTAAEFNALATSAAGPDPEFKVRVEQLDAVTADGRTFSVDRRGQPSGPSAPLDADFAAAANAIEQEGTIGPVAKSAFGYHVIYLEKRFAEERMGSDERRELLSADVMSARAKAILDGILQEQSQRHPVVLDRAVDTLTAEVKVER